jgi:hypothetical protein
MGTKQKEKRDAKNARHRKNEQRRRLRWIVNHCIAYAWDWPQERQNAEAKMWLEWK